MQENRPLNPLDKNRKASTFLCGGYILDDLYLEYFKQKRPETVSENTVPSISNMRSLEKGEQAVGFKYPWDLVIQNKKIIQENLEFKVKNGNFTKLQEGVYIGSNVTILPNVVFTADRSRFIVIDNDTEIYPFSYLEGPVFVGKNTKICDHASIKHAVSIGNNCKVGGEIEASVISNFSNKQHYGFLGHSFVGEWVNIGAGTSNSDLKNTYGEIKINYYNQKINTGEQFLGCFISDFCKTAIATKIYTGKIIGFNTHLYGDIVQDIPAFINLTKSISGKNSEFDLDTAIEVQSRMFKRRNRKQEEEDILLMKQIFTETKEARIDFLK